MEFSGPEFVRTMAKATVQKTVRFDPRLVARLEELNSKLMERGEQPKSFQQVQNDALRLWLDANQES